MTTHVVILCQGSQTRLPKLTAAKQMLPLPACNGMPILYRTLRQVWEFCDDVATVVAWFPLVDQLMRGPSMAYFPNVVTLPDPGNSSLKGIWRYLRKVEDERYAAMRRFERHESDEPTPRPDRTVVLLGDVVYSWACLRSLFDFDSARPRVRFVGTSDISPSGGELWGISWTCDADDLMTSSLAIALQKHPPFEEYQPGQLRRWMWAVHPELQKTDRYVAIDDYTRDIDLPEHVTGLPELSGSAATDDFANGVVW